MTDLISREAAAYIVDFECGEWRGLAMTIIDRFESLPSAERKGHWIELKCGSVSIWKCSECEEIFSENYHYCPNCGARMERE